MNPYDITRFISSLENDSREGADLRIPDGVIDLSDLSQPLVEVTREGRALDSSVPNAVGGFIARILRSSLPENPSIEDMGRTLISLTMLLSTILQRLPIASPDRSPEDYLIDLCDPWHLTAMREDLRVTPVVVEPDGTVRPNYAQMPVFNRAIPTTEEMFKRFADRHIVPHLEDERDGDESDEEPRLTRIELVDLKGTEDLTSDPFNGFDNYFDHYFDRENREASDDDDGGV